MLRSYMEKEGIEFLPKMGISCRKKRLLCQGCVSPSRLFSLAPGLAANIATVLKYHPYAPKKQALEEYSSQMTRESWQGSLFPKV